MKMVICTVEEQKFTIVDPQSFFDQNIDNYNAHNWFFDQFITIWNFFLNQRRFKSAEYVWEKALKFSYEWQEKNPNKKIHKGTPYYFCGVTCILNADLEKGFLLMHQALEEDKRTLQSDAPQTPAYYFVTLDYENQKQFFRPKVEEIAKFVDEKLNTYRSLKRGALTLSDFKSKFLENLALREVVFYFVFTIFNLKKLTQEIDKKLTENVFGSLLQGNTILDLCLIVENVIRKQIKYNWPKPKNELTMRNLLTQMSKELSLNLHRGSKGSKDNNFGKLNIDFKDFSKTLKELLSSQYHFQDGATLQPIEEDLAITYGFRNFGAHKIEDQPVIYKKFDEISGRILNALFFSVEKLYV
jgi:hypothetical protein